jgi:uncharacterized protein
MNAKIIGQSPKTIALICQTGDEAVASLQKVAQEFKLAASHFTAIGAFQEAVLGFFDWEKKDYQKIVFKEQLEVLSLIGDISLAGNKPQIHAHVVAGRADASTCGGHLIHGIVRPTLEIILVESPLHLRREYVPDLGLALIDLRLPK